eukprot:1062592-Prymnesium_polylepis.1
MNCLVSTRCASGDMPGEECEREGGLGSSSRPMADASAPWIDATDPLALWWFGPARAAEGSCD